ncbi:hypothetical protein ACTVKS_15370 [Serratia bockelmannii]|uniref:hypothetical protein n=1 Tax=Serratia bockelmannii TaxID=2703793 RepID=UPI003FA7468A
MDKFSELKAVAEKAKELAGINNYKKGKDAIVAFKAAANPAAILAMLAELEAKTLEGRGIEQERELFRVERTAHQQHAQELEKRIAELEKRLATPVRLPDIEFVKISGIDFPVMRADIVKKEVRRAGFKVEGDA